MLNTLLLDNGIDPRKVAVLRHAGQGRLGITPFDLWERHDGSYDRYQTTQKPGKPIFRNCSIWASFVSTPAKDTLFTGLYEARLDDKAKIDWPCPLNGERPGASKGYLSDLYAIKPLDRLANYIGKMTIEWGDGNIGWVRYASRNQFPIN